MKNFKRIMSLVLVAVMLLSFVCINAAPASAVNTYLASCTTYASNLSVKTTAVTRLMTYPCTTATNSSSSAKYTIPADTMLTVKSLVKNTANTYWYEVLYYNTTLYVDATATTLVDHLTGDVTMTNIQSPASLAYGSSFAIKGEISATQNKLGTVSVGMYSNTNITKEPAMVATDTPTGNTYSLEGSAIDYALVFGNLAAGVYTYVVTAEAISYYIDSTGALATSEQTVVLNTQECVITDWTNPNDDLAFGVDLSTWNGSIDWSQAKDDFDFCILRIGFSTTLDNRFLEYAANCETYNIPYGVYHYSYGMSVAEVTAEAQFVIDTLRSYGYNPKLGVWYDMEDSSQAALATSTKEAFVMAFCDTIADAGYMPGFYGFTSWFSSSFQKGYLSSLPQWIAQIDGFSSNGTATYDGGTWLWQYSWEGSISGISGDVDCNICYADFSVFNSDTSYLSKCTQYPARAMAKTADSVNLRQYPSSSYTSYGLLSADTELEITGLYKNASGEYWYQVVTGGQAGYVHSDYVTITEFLYDDLAVIDPAMASNLSVGSGYYLEGILTSKWNTINTTHAKIYSGEDTSASPVLSSSYTNNSKKYNLLRSAVCNNMIFGNLSEGYYTYEISADVKNYYVSGGTLTSKTENVVVWTTPFTVGSATITPPATIVCDHNTVTDKAVAPTCTETGLTAGSHCTKCGLVFEAQTVVPATGHSYSATSTPATCKEYEVFHVSCSGCDDSYDISADELANWSETKPLGVDESKIESKTQYRYADCASTSWEQTGTGTIAYVNSWPSGFSTSSSLYSQYNKKSSKVTASETATEKTVINSDAVQGYLYYHWCYTDSYYSVATSSGSYTTFHAYYDTTDPSTYTCDTSDMSYKTSHSSCSNTNWWFVAEVYGQNYSTYKLVVDGWDEWSAWSDTVYTPVANTRKVETRTVYRYTGAELGDHSWSNGVCSVCGTTCSHPSYVNGACSVCGKTETVVATDYYLFGYINGKDYACEGDYTNMGQYKFVNGKLTVTFTETSYVAVKTEGNANWYMTNGYPGNYVTSATLYNTTTLGTNANKLYVPGGVEVTFTLVNNGNDTFTLSYTATEPDPVVKPEITLKYPTLSFEGEVFYNVYYTVSNATVDVEDMGLLTWYNRPANTAAATYDTAEAIIPGAVYNSGSNIYMVHSEGVPAKMLGDNMYLRIYAKLSDGTYAYSPVTYYNAKFYASDILANSTNADMKSLVVAMLNYGAAAQVHFDHNADNLMNASLTAEQKALAKDYSADMISTVVTPSTTKTVNFKSNGGFSSGYPSVSFDGAFSINYYLTPKKTVESTMTLYCWNLATYNSVSALTEANATAKVEMVPATNPSEYFANYTGIAAKQIDETVFVAGVYTSGGVRYSSPVLYYSLSAYCADQISKGSATMQDFAKATVVYGDAAKTYFANLNG